MTSAETTTTLPWLTPALMALLLYGLGQGFVKMWIGEVSAARFCLYFACARALVMVSYFLAKLAYAADLGVLIASRYGRISLVTPLTGAYPVVTLAFAALVLQERIALLQWAASLHPGRDVLLHRLSASGEANLERAAFPAASASASSRKVTRCIAARSQRQRREPEQPRSSGPRRCD